MKKLSILIVSIVSIACSEKVSHSTDIDRWEDRASRVTIIRDNFGVPHIYGKSDADAVFGMLYAQCEDDFNRVETNYITALGRMAEVEGQDEIFSDLRMKLFIDPAELKQQYEESPDELKELMVAFADGINYYLHTHPDVKPRLITKFEPWMALSFSEGSIGGDIERVNTRQLEAFYSDSEPVSLNQVELDLLALNEEPRGSNGISISPKLTESGNTLFLINPHTSFFFRSEQHVNSEEGLSAYGAVTWGQFFIYQGFNDRLGWMHTSSRADAIDFYHETIVEEDGQFFYVHGDENKPVTEKTIEIPYTENDSLKSKSFTAYYTHHGPIVREEEEGKWVSIALMQRPVDALRQSYGRTKAKTYDEFYKTMQIRTNSSNNTVYADADGNIAYFHGNYIPVRDTSFNWNGLMDGSNPATDYKGLHTVDEMVTILNPENGWIQNCNSTPFTAAGEYSPSQEDFPTYMAPDNENFRGIHAVRVLDGKEGWTLDKLIDASYDSYLPGFEEIIPSLIQAYDNLKDDNEIDPEMAEALEMLRNWDMRWSAESIETSLAVFWGQFMLSNVYQDENRNGKDPYKYIAEDYPDDEKLYTLAEMMSLLLQDFGTWKIPWGDINRYQRITGDIQQPFNDDEPSLPVAFASGRWGSLASFGARLYPGTKKMYGTSGNSFVAFVEFGEKVRARSISTGGQSGDPDSPHFDDQALMYTQGEFKEVRFYKEDVEANMKEKYKPGEK